MQTSSCSGCGEDISYLDPGAYDGRCSTCYHCGPPRSRSASGVPSWREDSMTRASRNGAPALRVAPSATAEDWRREFVNLLDS